MTTVIAVVVLALLFSAFALLDPAEKAGPCGGRRTGEARCAGCPLGGSDGRSERGCPGLEVLEKSGVAAKVPQDPSRS